MTQTAATPVQPASIAHQRRRHLLAALSTLAGAACAPGVTGRPASPAPSRPLPDALPPAPAVPAAPPAPVVAAPAAAPLAEAALTKLGPGGIVQPFFAGDGARILFYDQPRPGQGGTWSLDPASKAVAFERPAWGYYVARGSIVAAARPARRDTYVQHVASGREWTLPTTSSTVFSADGTLVAYAGGGLTLAGADNQYARKVQPPFNATVLAWLAAADGSPNGWLLLSGRRVPGEDPALWAFDPQRRTVSQLVRSKRLVGVLPSPDGAWIAYWAMWNGGADDGLWVASADGSSRRKVGLSGSYRWTADNRLLLVPVRASAAGSHEVWEYLPSSGEARRLTDPAKLAFRIANSDWDVSPDGTQLVFVSGQDKGLWHLSLPRDLPRSATPVPGGVPAPGDASGGKPYRLPFTTPPGPSTWYVQQWYGVTTGGYRWRNTTYVQGQGIHFGIDFAAPIGTPVVAVAPGKVIAVDGDYGSPPHNVVIQLDDGNIAMYGHLWERSQHVQPGQRVEPGQVVGNTGDSLPPYDGTRNPHLHLEIRKGGRQIATNPVHYFDVNWDDLTLGVALNTWFERDLDAPARNQFLDDQPDIRFGGPVITNFARPWPV